MKRMTSRIAVIAAALAAFQVNLGAQVLFDVSPDRNTAAVGTATSEQMEKTPVSNITNTLFGLVPGLAVMQGSGQLGYDMAVMTIRGAGTFNSEDTYSVFVDGFETDPSFISYMLVSEIDKVYVLKDAAALAALGMKGANGAIWITTKRGEAGGVRINLNARTGWQAPKFIGKPLSASAYQEYYNEAFSNDGGMVWNPFYSSAPEYDTDWYDAVLKKSSPYHSTDLSISGGNSNIRFFTTLGYVRSNGFYDVKRDDTHANSSLDQYVVRTNLDFNMLGIFEGKVDVGGRLADNFAPNYSEDLLWYNMATYPNNIYGVFDQGVESNDTWAGTATHPDNPVASTRALGYQFRRDRTFMANTTLKEKLDFITPGLYLQEAVSFSTWTRGTYKMSRTYARLSGGEPQTEAVNSNYGPSDDKGTNQWSWNQFRAQAGYDRAFGKHAVSAAVAYEQYHRYVDASLNGSAGLQRTYAHQAVLGRANYSFDGRYVAEVALSWCGSDNYAKGNRFRFFPAASLAWNISEEPFLKGVSAVDVLRLRASAGAVGYDLYSGGRYLYDSYYVAGNSYPTNNSGSPTWNSSLVPSFLENPSLTSETALKFNVGVDAKLLSSLGITLDAYLEKRSGIITPDNSYPAAIGVNPPYRNIGKVTTAGMEIGIDYHKHFGDFVLGAGAMASFLSDRIDYMAEIPTASPDAALTGRNIGAVIGYRNDGFYDVSDFAADGSLKGGLPVPSFGTVQPGDVRYKDLNGDKTIDERDKTFLGKGSYPYLYYSATLSLGYKGIDFSVLVQGAGLRQVNLLDAASKVIAFRGNTNIFPIAEGRWAYYPEQGIDNRAQATYPRLSAGANTNNYLTSDLWLRSGSFVTLRNVELGYTLPEKLTRKIAIRTLRFFVNGVNLLTISPLMSKAGLDPERMTGYPGIKSVNLGLNIGF